MKTDLQLSHLSVHPGQSARLDIDVTNTASVIDGVTAIVDGVSPDWVRLERPLVSIFPDATDQVGINLDIPRDCPAGDYLIVVRIVSTISADRQSVQDFWLTVDPVVEVGLVLQPSIVTGGKKARLQTIVVNSGNVAAEVMVSALDPTREVDCTVQPSTITIPMGHEALIDVDLKGLRPWFGQPVQRSILVAARTEDSVVEAVGTFNQKPRIPRGVITALILATIIALWALIFLWVARQLRSAQDPTKAVATDLFTGRPDVPLASIAGSVAGTVTAASNGQGVARVTVEALRMTTGDELVSVGSTATEDDGAYSLLSLVPGTYKLRISADGFGDLWYPDSIDSARAEDLKIPPGVVRDDLDVVLTGLTGRLTGEIALPPDAPPVVLTVTATQVIEQGSTATADAEQATVDGAPVADASPEADASEAPTFTSETTDGTIDLDGLPTPATYLVTVKAPGFQTQQFQAEVGPGDQTVLNTVQLAAADGSISGIVTDSAGNALGGVTISARSGDDEVQVTTPTSGDRGRFEILGLPSPQTYVLTFELPDYSGKTLALNLGAGQDLTGLTTSLVGGNGTLTGLVFSADGNPAGGVSVEIVGDGFITETSTLTTGSAGSAAGSFSITELPVPGNYALSFSSDAFQTESVSATFSSAGTQDVGTITMVSTTAQVRGTVLNAATGIGVGDITVTLSDGAVPRETRSATNPLGIFAFADIPAGTYTLTFESPNFDTRVVLLSVDAGIDVARTVSISPAGVPAR